jgi:hypothetical protein
MQHPHPHFTMATLRKQLHLGDVLRRRTAVHRGSVRVEHAPLAHARRHLLPRVCRVHLDVAAAALARQGRGLRGCQRCRGTLAAGGIASDALLTRACVCRRGVVGRSARERRLHRRRKPSAD